MLTNVCPSHVPPLCIPYITEKALCERVARLKICRSHRIKDFIWKSWVPGHEAGLPEGRLWDNTPEAKHSPPKQQQTNTQKFLLGPRARCPPPWDITKEASKNLTSKNRTKPNPNTGNLFNTGLWLTLIHISYPTQPKNTS